MKRFIPNLVKIVLSLLLFVGCNPVEPNTPLPEDESPSFDLKINEVTKTSVSFTVTPLTDNIPYVALIIDKVFFDEFESVDDYINDDLDWFAERASNDGISLSEWLSKNTNVGTLIDTEEGLVPDSEYYLYAYHINSHGEVVSDLVKKEFRTEGYVLTDEGFEITVSDITYDTAKIGFVPESKDKPYFFNVMSESEYEYYGADEMAYVRQLEALRDHYLGFGKTPAEMIANLCFVGDGYWTAENLLAGRKYYAYALGVDEEFMACTKATVEEFRTIAPDASTLTFQWDIQRVFYDHAEGVVLPSNDDSYICSVQLAETLTWYPTHDDYMYSLVENLEWYGGVESALRSGPSDLAAHVGLQPETEYAIICFGWNGAPTTELFYTTFTTTKADGNPEDLEVDFEVVDVDFNELRVAYLPSVGAYYYASIVEESVLAERVASVGGLNEALLALADEEIEYGANFFHYTRAEYLAEMGGCVGRSELYFNRLAQNTPYVAFAVAVDMTTGELASQRASASEPIYTREKILGNAKVEFEIGDYYDGTALAELDAKLFGKCVGMAVVPYDVIPNESAVTWYTTYNVSDYTEWGCTDEDIYTELITYGYNYNVESVVVNSEGGVAVLYYDNPYTFVGLAQDAEENYGPGTLYVVTPKRSEVSPAEEFIASLESMSAPLLSAAKREVPTCEPRISERQTSLQMMEPSVKSDLSREVKSEPTKRAIGRRYVVLP